ncbi:hypothetical protein ASPCAL00860 [Aspergillus calidoustus]|uniref:Uncharacterized protein n=1 Tax=Aspergillus calidoustus TaxID=454130 RepID=A0A0U5FTE5_ASPCI|nr:hypothetical protein ASPCAL00860 [Aspergillus calidoustus]
MARPNEPPTTTNIPPFAKPLAPYIKTRQETLRIRQILTAYLQSLITYDDNDPEHQTRLAQSHFSLCVPDNAVKGVKRIPTEVTGLRREYLQALQANVASRKQHQLVSEKLAAAARVEPGATPSHDSSLELSSYLKLVQDRRRHAKLQVFGHYLQELRGRDTATVEDFEKRDRNQLALHENLVQEDHNGSGARDTDIERLVQKLERAVICAKSQLDREKKLYEDLKARNESIGFSKDAADPSAKVAALQRTRDELVHWVEAKLVGSGNNGEAPVAELPAEEIEESARILEEQRVRIREQYAAYTDTRKRLLEAAARACQPVLTASTKPPSQPPDLRGMSVEESLPIEPLEVLSFASSILHPLSKNQRSLALQKFYLSGLLAKEKATTLRILNRLSDESHLLPEYPILARQPRFNHATAALGSRQAASQPDPAKQDEIINMAEAWAFASAAAGSNVKEYVEQKVGDGSERAQVAQQELQRVYDLLNQSLEEALEDDQAGQASSDIWASEAQSTRSGTRLARSNQRSKGPWSRLNGKVCVDD